MRLALRPRPRRRPFPRTPTRQRRCRPPRSRPAPRRLSPSPRRPTLNRSPRRWDCRSTTGPRRISTVTGSKGII
ncbi:hypothetical protein FBQ81_12225 [Chloroflexi bacterium CFX6]|nr:hypothetical protein [Chloroflexi bacterium CFX6]